MQTGKAFLIVEYRGKHEDLQNYDDVMLGMKYAEENTK